MARGVEVFKGRVRIGFKWQGKRVYETTEFRPTASGITEAGKLRAEIIESIKYDRFQYADYFPDSVRAGSDSCTFYDMAKKYITLVESQKSVSTIAGYRKSINRYWLPEFRKRPIAGITTGDIRDAISTSGLLKLSPKTFNNAMTPLRGIFDLAVDFEFINLNPCKKVKAQKWQPPLPDPLTQIEMNRILAELSDHWTPYFQVAFGTGARPSELLALRWQDIDLQQKIVRIQRGYVNHTTNDQTKTHKARDTELSALALDGLKAQKSRTFLSGDLVFVDLKGKQIVSEKPPRLEWNRALKKLGIRHRVAYATRETFISYALSEGININQVAYQAGNSPAIIMKHYGKWIPQQNSGIRDLFSDSKTDSKPSVSRGV